MYKLSRRRLLASSAVALLGRGSAAHALTLRDGLPWQPGAADPPATVTPGGWHYFNPQEAATVEAFVDRLIPPDAETPGGKDCGCAVFIDRQLAGPYGRAEGLYMSGPFRSGTKQQGSQSARNASAALPQGARGARCRLQRKYDGKAFAELSDEQKDEVIKGLEDGSLKLEGTDGQDFFKLILKDTQNGFLADPIYGGNKDMASWKMIGFPGAHYDYRDWIDRHNQRVTLPAVGINNHPNWSR